VAVHRGRVRVGEVSADALDAAARVLSTDLFGGRLQFGLRPADQHDVHAAAGQLPGVSLAQPVRGACHNLNTIARARKHTFYTRVDRLLFLYIILPLREAHPHGRHRHAIMKTKNSKRK